MKYLIKAEKIYTDSGVIENGAVLVEDGNIMDVGLLERALENTEVIELEGLSLLPGLIDIHVHGGNGFEAMDASYEAVNAISVYKLKEGVTSFCPSTVTSSMERTEAAVAAIAGAVAAGVDGAKIIGAFLEGPYICEKYKGAHPKEWIREIDLDEIQALIKAGGGTICSFAIAPEKRGASEAVKYLVSQGVNVRLGHTAATYDEAVKAVGLGANTAIHTFNAMSPLNHREAGMVGAVLLSDMYAELICDLVHISPEAVRVLYKCKGAGGIVLITDCMRAGGLADGEYLLGDLPVIVNGNEARLPDGTLAGSTLGLLTALKNMIDVTGAPLEEALAMASENPAKAVGIFDKTGSISAGKRADLIAVDEDFRLKFVMVDGIVKIGIMER